MMERQPFVMPMPTYRCISESCRHKVSQLLSTTTPTGERCAVRGTEKVRIAIVLFGMVRSLLTWPSLRSNLVATAAAASAGAIDIFVHGMVGRAENTHVTAECPDKPLDASDP